MSDPHHPPWLLKIIRTDWVLAVALCVGLLFSVYGMTWGSGQSWHPDEMAFRGLFSAKTLPFEPMSFNRPPFHTYFNYFLSVLPFDLLQQTASKLVASPVNLGIVRLYWSRLLTVFLFLGSIALAYHITQRYFGRFAARSLALLVATSGGLVVEAHFLTADMPVLFWMLVAFCFMQNISLRGQRSDYLWAGFFIGIATATKYNGLAVGIAIPIAHLLRPGPRYWKQELSDKKVYLSLGMVVVGFVAGNPFALLTFSKFIEQFWYTYQATPIWDGSSPDQCSYGDFIFRLTEVIGLPSTLILAAGFLFSLYLLFRSPQKDMERQGFILLLSICVPYYYMFGGFPHIETRFVMPMVPFWMILSGPFWESIRIKKSIRFVLLIILVGYNALCSFYVGKRFAEDPRIIAMHWVKTRIPANSSIESTAYVPNWKAAGARVHDQRLPLVTGRRAIFEEAFRENPWMLARVRRIEEEKPADAYSENQLKVRKPDFIAINSLYYNRFFSGKSSRQYPFVREYFQNLLNGQYGYKVVFDRTTPIPSAWFYPRSILFVDNRMVILQRKDLPD
jgi:4-amino-4-deoxy-L-arabinose transferase-like glycosyltransferase